MSTPEGGRPCLSQITATRGKSTARARRAWVSLEHAALQVATGWHGVGNAIVRPFIELANKDTEASFRQVPDKDLACCEERALCFCAHVRSLGLAQHSTAQRFAPIKRELMMILLFASVLKPIPKPSETQVEPVNWLHDDAQQQRDRGGDVFVPRKGPLGAKRAP